MRSLLVISILAAALPLLAQQDDRYVVRLDPAAAVDRVGVLAAQLASAHGASILSTDSETEDTIVLRVSPSRVRTLKADPRVQSVTSLKVAAEAIIEPVNWSVGVPYTYDGAGSVKTIGNGTDADAFVYDAVGRLVQAKVNLVTRTYEYDAFGNRKKCAAPATDCQYTIEIDSRNNRIDETDADHDAAGNVTVLGGHVYSYDAMNMMSRDHSAAGKYEYLYTADDERLATYNATTGTWEWTLRDYTGQVIREFTSTNAGAWQWQRDYVHRGTLLLASRIPFAAGATTHHYHLDHLGTPRRVTGDDDRIIGYHDYYAFGPEIAGSLQEPGAADRRYTGHEREPGSDEYTLDYMHARFYSSMLGRFLSSDPLSASVNTARPQTWNRYSYVVNAPMDATDPSGAVLKSVTGQNTLRDIAGSAAANLSFRPDGTIDTTQFTPQDLTRNEGALLLRQMAVSTNVYTYEEGNTAPSRGAVQNVSGVLNLDDNPTDIILPNGNPHVKGPGRFPPNGVNGAVTVNPADQYYDKATGTLKVPTRAIAFHELAESYAKVEQNILRGPDNGPGAHQIARLREVILMMQRPNWTPFPAGGELKR